MHQLTEEERLQRHTLESQCLDALDALDVPWTLVHHAPVATVEAARSVRGELDGAHVKNLFLTDRRKSRYWLVTTLEDTQVDLKALRVALDARGGLRFASPERLEAVVGLQPGSVTPLAVLNDDAGAVTVVLDARLRDHTRICVHPLHNAATITLTVADLERVLVAHDHRPWWMDLPRR